MQFLVKMALTGLFLFFPVMAVPAQEKTIRIVATIGQISDVTKMVGGKWVAVSGLMGPGVDPHLYKASESDVMKLSKADIIFYNGINLEAKMADIFGRMAKSKKTVAVTKDIASERLLGDANFTEHYDPHVWFDVTLWMEVVKTIAAELVHFDPAHALDYDAESQRYLAELEKLHEYVVQRTEEVPEQQRVLVTAHDAFRYFGRAYGFEVIGLQGLSTETEAGTADVMRLAEFIAQRKIKAIFIESSIPERNIKAVQESVRAKGWDVKIGGELFSDAMGAQGTFEGTYIGMVTHNINTIVEALK